MTNAGVGGFPSTADGSVTARKLAPSLNWGYLASGNYYFAAGHSNPNTGTLGTGNLRLAPWFVPNPIVLARLGAEVTTVGDAGSKFRLGVYADNGYSYPGALLLDAGTIAGDSGTIQEVVVSLALQPGLYWLGGATQVVSVTQPTMRTVGAVPGNLTVPIALFSTPGTGATGQGYVQSSVTGALPAQFSPAQAPSGSMQRIHFKVG